mgnify:CR=1 FL=1
MQYVTVSLLGLDSSFVKGCMTDTLGAYRMDGVVAGDYVLTFDMLGYEPERAPVYISGDVKMDVRLNPASEQLGEVTVKGSTFIRQEDKLLIIPDKVSVKHSVTGYDLLDNLMIPAWMLTAARGRSFRPKVV